MSDHRPWDPFSPSSGAAVALPKPSTLPINRLRRLGMDLRGLSALDFWWEAMDHATRIKTAEHLSVLTDDQLASYVGAVEQLDAADAATVLGWVTGAPVHKRQSNASLALAVESTRQPRRPELVDSLQALV